MATVYDVIVLGVGGMGSAACYQLARRGLKVLGLEQFSLVHDRGSSHGQTRIIRQAYFEHPNYVPLLLRTYDLWSEFEKESGRSLFQRVGLILSGRPESDTIHGAKLSAEFHRLVIEELTPSEGHSRWPSMKFPEDHAVVFEPAAGLLRVESCVETCVQQALRLGADIRGNEPVVEWNSNGASVHVRTSTGEYVAKSLVVCAGPWAGQCLKDLGCQLTVLRKFVGWFPIQSGEYRADADMPTFYYELPHGTFYGLPSIDGESVKVAEHSGGQVTDPDYVDRSMHDSDTDRLADFIRGHLPGLNPQIDRYSVCLYTLSPDQHFIVDLHPEWKNVVIAAGFSGHGFKFAPVIGEALADLAMTGTSSLPIDFLGLSRFRQRSV